MGLDGKVAFITGGGSGIGRGIAERLAREGADIFMMDIDEAGAEETAARVAQYGRRALVFRGNVSSSVHMEEAAAQCVAELGRLDIAVANAGIGRGAHVLEMKLEDWQQQIDVNLTGVFLTVQACGRQMVSCGNGGRIVCLASLAAETTGPGIWSYSATKAGVRIMVRGWAQELGPNGITVNAIGPGVIDTPLAAGLAGKEGGLIRQALEETTPLGRVGRPSDIAGLVNFMVGEDGEFMTGEYVIMDGGLRDARRRPEPQGEVLKEVMENMASAEERRKRMQNMQDEIE